MSARRSGVRGLDGSEPLRSVTYQSPVRSPDYHLHDALAHQRIAVGSCSCDCAGCRAGRCSLARTVVSREEAAANALGAARRVTAMLDGDPGDWTLDGITITEEAASELLSLHDYLNEEAALAAKAEKR